MSRIYGMGKRSFNKHEANSHRAMQERCYNKNYRAYHRYGGRGIKVCERWLGRDGFANFLDDMGKKPSSKHTLDRIDNDKDYSPENCRWADQKTQVRNSTKTIKITIDGVTKTLPEWCEIYGTTGGGVANRVRDGWTIETALKVPKNIPGKNFRGKYIGVSL